MSLNPTWLFLSVVISFVGLAIFVYGRKAGRTPQLVAGIVLMVYPYFVSSAGWMAGIAAGVLAGLWWSVHQGW